MAILSKIGAAVAAALDHQSADLTASRRAKKPRYVYRQTEQVHCIQWTPKGGTIKHCLVRAMLLPTSKYAPGPSIPGGLRRRMATERQWLPHQLAAIKRLESTVDLDRRLPPMVKEGVA